MQKNKIDFIVDLLADKRIDTPLRERVIELAAKQISNIETESLRQLSEIKNDVKNILNAVNKNNGGIVEIKAQIEANGNNRFKNQRDLTISKQQDNNTNRHPKKEPVIAPNPLHTKKFLNYFRDSEGLKFLTHGFPDIAKPIPLETLMQISRKEFEEAKKKYPNTNQKLIRRVEEFAFSEDPKWTVRKGDEVETITFGWSSKAFIEWSEKSTVKHPCRSPEWDKKMILPFKKTIEVRDGLLLEVVEESIKLVFSDADLELFTIKYDKNNLISANFFTDVDWFGQAIYKILTGIKDRGEKQNNYEISIEYNGNIEDTYKSVKIIHRNSKPLRDSNFKFTDGGDFKDIKNALWSLCNWAIEAEFSNGYRRKYLLWDSNIKKNDVEIPQNDVKGFTHLLLFY